MDKYEPVREIGAGNFGVTKLMRNKDTRDLVAMKFIERGNRIDDYVFREIVNHRSLRHPNIIRFNEVVLTPTHLATVMEYAAGGQLFERMCEAGRFLEDEARYFFQQLVCGVSFCHAMNICHRHIKLENRLLDGSPEPRLKICNFRYSSRGCCTPAPSQRWARRGTSRPRCCHGASTTASRPTCGPAASRSTSCSSGRTRSRIPRIPRTSERRSRGSSRCSTRSPSTCTSPRTAATSSPASSSRTRPRGSP